MAMTHTEHIAPRTVITRWPVDWSAIWVGALAALVVALIIALIGVAVGAQHAAMTRIVRWREFGLGSLIFTVFGTFLSFAAGGWIAGRIAGLGRAEPTILHAAIAWLLGVILIMGAGSFGGAAFGPWYRGIALRAPGIPVAVEDPDTARAARNAALGGVAALLLGLTGAVVGGWMASGEPMTLTYYRSRARRAA